MNFLKIRFLNVCVLSISGFPQFLGFLSPPRGTRSRSGVRPGPQPGGAAPGAAAADEGAAAVPARPEPRQAPGAVLPRLHGDGQNLRQLHARPPPLPGRAGQPLRPPLLPHRALPPRRAHRAVQGKASQRCSLLLWALVASL